MSKLDQGQLPSDFTDLECYSSWMLEDEIARRNKCVASSMGEIQEFYDTMLASMDEILAHLNQFPLHELPIKEQNLLALVLGFVEAAISVEMFGEPEIKYGMPMERFRPLHHLVP